MRSCQIYIEGNRLELFDDENIIVNSSVQNIFDLSKVFTDFSQQFTAPASPYNNALVQHFYDYDVDGTLDHNLRRKGTIEIDYTPFRTGKIQLEKSNEEDGEVKSYTFTFYGDVVTFKDLVKDDKLNSLDFTSLNHPYNGTQVLSRINNSVLSDIQYPLISSVRVWQYDNVATPTDDINTTTGRMDYRELFPAVKVSKIMEFIQVKYGVSFTGLIFNDDRFKSLYLYCKNKERMQLNTASEVLNFISETPVNDYFDLSNDSLTFGYDDNLSELALHEILVNLVNTSNISATYTVEIYLNGALYSTVTKQGYGTTIAYTQFNSQGVGGVFTFRVFSDTPLTTLQIDVTYRRRIIGSSFVETFVARSSNDLDVTMNIGDFIPEMKVLDFMTGLFKQFNLTAYGLSPTSFLIETVEDFYNRGRVIDITPHTDIDSIEKERTRLYKRIEFKHQESQSLMNKAYYDNFTNQYGDINYQYPYDSEDYVVELPFENLLFNKFTGTNLQVGYAVTPAPDSKPYITKPVLMYAYGNLPVSFKFFDGTTEQTVTSYVAMGQDVVYNGENFSLNFGQDTSSLLNTPVLNGIFNTYYLASLSNFYNRKARLTRVKTVLPISILTSLKLNDRLLIRDHRFIINDLKTNITTGECNMVLLNDYRKLRVTRPIKPGKTFTNIKVPILLPNGAISGIIATSPDYTASAYIVTSDQIVEFEITPNPDPMSRVLREDGDFLLREDAGYILREDSGPGTGDRYILIDLTYTHNNGDIEENQIVIIQE